MAQIGKFTVGDCRKVAEATRRVLGGPRTMLSVPYRPAIRQGGGGDCACVTVHEIATNGAVTGGTVILDVSIDDGSVVTNESVTLNWDDTASEVKTAFVTHSKIASGDIKVKGGPLPDTAVYVIYLSSGTLNRDQSPPTLNTNSLTGTNVRIKTGYMTSADWEA